MFISIYLKVHKNTYLKELLGKKLWNLLKLNKCVISEVCSDLIEAASNFKLPNYVDLSCK